MAVDLVQNGVHSSPKSHFMHDEISLRCPAVSKPNQPKRTMNAPRYLERALSNTLSFSYHCLFSIDVSWLYAHGREILWGRPRDAKAKSDSTSGISSYQGRRLG